MRTFTLLSAILLFITSNLLSQEIITSSIVHDGLERDYILYIPSSYEPGNPLLLNFHGYTSPAAAQMAYGDFRSIADTAGFMIACPEGTIDNQGNLHWNVGWGSSTVDDIGFAAAFLDSLQAIYAYDMDRVYSTGMSNGGFMSYTLACELSERIAAIASVTGTMNLGSFSTCDCQHPMPVMEIHGTDDGTVAYEGAFWIEGSEDVVAYWADLNGITNPPVISPVPDVDPEDGCTAEHWVYANGENGAEVELYKVLDGGHTWPGAAFDIGVTNYDFDASTEIWRFFSKYDINGLISPDGFDEQTMATIGVYPNPTKDELMVEWSETHTPYKIYDRLGTLVIQGQLKPGQNSIDLTILSKGTYVLSAAGLVRQITRE